MIGQKSSNKGHVVILMSCAVAIILQPFFFFLLTLPDITQRKIWPYSIQIQSKTYFCNETVFVCTHFCSCKYESEADCKWLHVELSVRVQKVQKFLCMQAQEHILDVRVSAA